MVIRKLGPYMGAATMGLIGGSFIGMLLTEFGYDKLTDDGARIIPKTAEVQDGYIPPAEIQGITDPDLDGDGFGQTIITVGGEPYLVLDIDGKPVLSGYEITLKEK